MEGRSLFRRKALKSARIIHNLGRSSMTVKIVNMSDVGAKIQLGVAWPCPQVFDLEIDNPNTGRPITHHCQLVWQKGYDIGARYIIREMI
jgi:hypothetical protein